MREKERNALEHLSGNLEVDADIFMAFKKDLGDKEDEVGGMVMSDLRKASRILAELAKVKYKFIGENLVARDFVGLENAFLNCREIAEEGAEK